MGDGAGEAAYGVELLGLQDDLLGALGFGDVDAEDDDAVDVSVGVAAGLVDEIEIAKLEGARRSAARRMGVPRPTKGSPV